MMKRRRLVIVGIGETAELACEYFEDDSDYEVVGFAVNEEYKDSDECMGLPVFALESLGSELPPDEVDAFVAVAYGHLNGDRMKLCAVLSEMGYELASYVSSRSFIGRNVSIGKNSFIMEGCSLQHHVHIGDGVTMWSGCMIEHRSEIGDYAWIASGVVVSGYCHIGDRSFIGSNATFVDEVSVAPRCIIGASALVGESLPMEGRMYIAANRLFPVDEGRYREFAGIDPAGDKEESR